jgi:hypothetical protein
MSNRPHDWTERRNADRRAKLASLNDWLKGAERRERQRRAIVSARQADWHARYCAALTE